MDTINNTAADTYAISLIIYSNLLRTTYEKCGVNSTKLALALCRTYSQCRRNFVLNNILSAVTPIC